MSSPDFSQYVDLTIFDSQPTQIYENAIDYARLAVPELDIIPGTIEDALLQAFAQMTGFTAGAINRLPNGVAEIVFQILGITRQSGTAATGSASFSFVDNAVHEVPLGTRIAYTDTSVSPGVVYLFQTTETVSASAGVSAGIEGVTLEQYPTLVSGQAMRLITPISYISNVVLDVDLDVGSGPESDTEYFNRAATTVGSFSVALTTAEQFTNYVLATYPSTYRVKAYGRVDPQDTAVATALVNGYLTIFACGQDGDVLSTSEPTLFTSIEEDLTDKAVAGLQITVLDPTLVEFDLTASLSISTTADVASVKQAVVDAINGYLHPDFWDWSTTVRYNELIALISNVANVNYVDALTITTASGFATANGDDWVFDNYGTLPTNTFATTDISTV